MCDITENPVIITDLLYHTPSVIISVRDTTCVMVKISRGREIPCMKSHTKMKYHTRTFGSAPPPAEPASAVYGLCILGVRRVDHSDVIALWGTVQQRVDDLQK